MFPAVASCEAPGILPPAQEPPQGDLTTWDKQLGCRKGAQGVRLEYSGSMDIAKHVLLACGVVLATGAVIILDGGLSLPRP